MATKNRYWCFIAYPDSLTAGWEQILEETLLPCYISPLHLYDRFPDGTSKKPHYHIIVCFEGPTTYKNVLDNICAPLNASIPKQVLTLKGAYDYLTHKNAPNKYQYAPEDIVYLNGATEQIIDKEKATGDAFYFIETFIVDNNIKSFRQLSLAIHSLNNSLLSSVVRGNAYYFTQFLK